MTLSKAASASVALAIAAAIASPSMAQTAARGAPVETPPTGPVVPGVCVFNPERAVGTSTIGQFLVTRLNQLGSSVNAEIQADGTQLQTESTALQAKQATVSKTQFDNEKAAFETKVQAFQRKRELRNIQLQLTKGKALQQIGAALGPAVKQVFQQRGCSVLINAESLYMYVPAADLTDAAVQGLNGKLTTMSVDLASEQDAILAVQQQQQQQGR
jgi:Skp family chaperone for outer membrane proteins